MATTVAVTFRIERSVIEKARDRAGGGDKFTEVLRRMTAMYAAGKIPPDMPERLMAARVKIEQALVVLDATMEAGLEDLTVDSSDGVTAV